METIDSVVNSAKSFCEKHDEISFGFLFGSCARQRITQGSDIDIAVYLKTEDENFEREAQIELERLLKKEVDLVILNRAPATLSWNILKKGAPLAIKNRYSYLDFLLTVSGESDDFLDFNLDAWRMKCERSTADKERLMTSLPKCDGGELVNRCSSYW